MQRHGLLTFLRLKIIAIVIRLGAKLVQYWNARRDAQLCRGIETSKISVASRDPKRFIECCLYYPPGYSAAKQPTSKLPVLVNWHGSGYVIPSLGTDAAFCARVARELGILVLDADYRKGPETPFPGALCDVHDVLAWVAGGRTYFDSTRVAVSGFSAGGALALTASSLVVKEFPDTLQIRVVAALYPPADLSIPYSEKIVPSPKKIIPPPIARFFTASYVPDVEMRKDPRVSPGLSDAQDFPGHVAIITCSGDTLAPESNRLAAKLRDGKRKVVNETLEGTWHAFDKGCARGSPEWEQRETAYNLMIGTIKDGLGL